MIVGCPQCQTTYDLELPDDGRVSTVTCENSDACNCQFDVKTRPALITESTIRVTEAHPEVLIDGNPVGPVYKLHKYIEMPQTNGAVASTGPALADVIFHLSEEDKDKLNSIYEKVNELGLMARMWQAMFDWVSHLRGESSQQEG